MFLGSITQERVRQSPDGLEIEKKGEKVGRRKVVFKLTMLVFNVRTFALEVRTLVFKVRKKD